MQELHIPPGAFGNPDAYEILRVWEANGYQYVSIDTELDAEAEDFGYMLAQLAYHGAKLFAGKLGMNESDTFLAVLDGFNEGISQEDGRVDGYIDDEGDDEE